MKLKWEDLTDNERELVKARARGLVEASRGIMSDELAFRAAMDSFANERRGLEIRRHERRERMAEDAWWNKG